MRRFASGETSDNLVRIAYSIMTQLSESTYGALRFLLSLLDVGEEEAKKEVEVFERGLTARVVDKLLQKLPEAERKPVAELANNVGEGQENQEELTQKMKTLFNAKEIAGVYTQEGEAFFKEVLKEEYQKATEEQKKKLEEMFKINSLSS